jgi:hypothetical protein
VCYLALKLRAEGGSECGLIGRTVGIYERAQNLKNNNTARRKKNYEKLVRTTYCKYTQIIVEAMNNRSQCVFQQRHNNKKSISFINI